MNDLKVVLKRNNISHTYFSDSRGCFIQTDETGRESVIMEGISGEFDGICDEGGCLHFLMETNAGELVYLRYDGNVWKKYMLFKSRNSRSGISKINLIASGDVLCGFYALERRNQVLVVRHIFRYDALFNTPEVEGVTDFRKSIFVCADKRGFVHLFFRGEDGGYTKKVYDVGLRRVYERQNIFEDDIYNLCASDSDSGFVYVYTTVRKGYTALIFKKENSDEKIITFGIARNATLGVKTHKNEIEIVWNESGTTMCVKSTDSGKTFSKPKADTNKADMLYMKHRDFENNIDAEGKRKVNMRESQRYIKNDMDASEFEKHLKIIEAAVNKIGKDTDKICKLLNVITDIKAKSEAINTVMFSSAKPASLNSEDNIGERNEENIKMFESMDIDEVIQENRIQ